jgi:casein kinase II subunit alpha
VAIKILKPVKKNKIRREVKILEMVSDGPNIAKLVDVVRDPSTKSPAIITEFVKQGNMRKVWSELSHDEVRFFMFELLKAIDYVHSKGIMHRDIKIHNVVINREKKQLRLIDFGLAEFYKPDSTYSHRVAAMFYKAPELLLGYEKYDYSIDMWGFGCILAGVILQKNRLFASIDRFSVLVKIAKQIGSKDLFTFIEENNIPVDDLEALKSTIGKHTGKEWSKLVDPKNEHLATPEALDLLTNLM